MILVCAMHNIFPIFHVRKEKDVVYNKLWKDVRLDPNITYELRTTLDLVEGYVGAGKLYIHRLYDPNAGPTSQHKHGKAADGHIEGMHVLDQYVLMERFPFTGLGIYPQDIWNNPGFHVDVRKSSIGRRWGYIPKSDGGRRMVALGRNFFEHILSLD